ncbi:PGF-pre-PGF domain-containing protein [Methanolobus vulcani]|nr:PGF-pre-PGF domain-containing protein [Methanolobus vulcani]
MCAKNKILICLAMIIMSTPFSVSAGINNTDLANDDMLLLKAGHVNTTDSGESQNEIQSMSSLLLDRSSNYYIVQFSGLVKEEWKYNVSSKGAELYDYVPNNAFIVKMNSSIKNQVQLLDFVKWVGEYKSSYKYDPEITTGNTDTEFLFIEKEETQRYYVSLFSEDEYTLTVESLEAFGIEVLGGYRKTISVQASKDQIDDIATITGISWIEEYIQPTIHNNVAAEIITTDVVHDAYGLKGTNQTVAVADTGIDIGVNNESMHADLRGRIVAIFDIAGDNEKADLYSGHGTHVSGSVLGNGSKSGGLYAGMAPEAELVFQALGYYNTITGSEGLKLPYGGLEELFQQAYDEGARIHTNSWGSDEYGTYTEHSKQVDQFMWDHQDMLILFSAGNEGVDSDRDGVIDEDSLCSPATAKNCLTVGASENNRGSKFSIGDYTTWGHAWNASFPVYPISNDYMADDSNGIAAFSSRGPTNDERIKPDVVAPGTFIASTISSVASGTGWGVVSDNSYYLYMGGTSMSTPITAGAAALVREYYTEVENLTSPSAALLKATIINGAYNITPGQYGTGDYQEIDGRYDYSQGWGRVDITNSIYPDSPVVMRYYDYVSLNSSESWNVSYDILCTSETVRITLVWTDYPYAETSDDNNLTLVNNLDLIVEAPDGTYYGNGAPDIKNNVEGVELLEPVAGTYTIIVNGTNIPKGPQNFSLVLSYGEVGDIYMYPEHNSYTTNASTEVYMNLTHADGINQSSIEMQIDGLSVLFSNETISSGYKIQNITAQSYSEGFHNVSVSALTNQNEELNYGWRFYVSVEDNILTVQSPLENSVIQENTVMINASDNKWCDFWYNINNGVNSTSEYGYSFNTSTELEEGTYNITLFARDITNYTNSTTVNFTVFTEPADIDSPTSGTIYYLPDSSSFTLNGTVGVATNVSVYVNGALTNYSEPVSNGVFNVSNVPLSNGTNTINVSAMYNNSLTNYFTANTTIYLNLGQTVDTSSGDIINVPVPGISDNVSNPMFNFNISGTSSNPGNISASVVRGTEPGNDSFLAASPIDIRVINNSDENYSYQFGRNVSLTLGYDPYPVNNTDKLTVAWYDPDDGTWIPYRSIINSTAHTVTANITHLSIYAPLEDNTEPVISSVTNSSTSSTVTLAWNSSEDTNYVEVWRTGSLLGNYSGYGITDTGLSASTLYNYSLRAVDYVGNMGEWCNTSVRTSAATSTPSSSSSSGGGGGGGGGSTGEDVDNIAFKDVLSVYAGKDDLVDFDFTNEQNEVDYVRYTSLKNAGKISVTIEMLKNTSALVDESASGFVYKNMNIWVGKTGYATESNIKDPVIGFMVSKEWVDDNDINIDTIGLNRYSEDVWTKLDTEQTGSDEDYYYFEASTPGFSPFAVTADIPITLDKENEEKSATESVTASEQLINEEGNESAAEENNGETDKNTPALSGLITLATLVVASAFIRKQQN